MNEIPTDGLENMAELDKGLRIIVRARGPASATSVRTSSWYVQFIGAGFSGLVAKGRLQKVDVSSFVGGDLLVTAIRPLGETSVYEILLRESGESLGVERILEMLQSECEVQDVGV
jgi:hypothetical protein